MKSPAAGDDKSPSETVGLSGAPEERTDAMAAVTGLTLTKSFPYRGDTTETFSNTYHFKGAPPGDDPSWTVLMNDVVNVERQIFTGDIKFISAYGYDSDAEVPHAVFSHDFTVPGPPPTGALGPPADGYRFAGDQAALVEWRTDQRSSKNKPIYLRKYFHGGFMHSTADNDALSPIYVTELTAYSTAVAAIHGGLRSRTHDLNVLEHIVFPWATTRTLKRRGKRPVPNP